MPGSGELVAVREVVAGVQAGGQVKHQVMEGGMLEDFRVRQRRMATRPLLAAPERTVQVQHHVAEHVAHQQQPQEIVTEELQHAGLYELRDYGLSSMALNIGGKRFDSMEKDAPRQSFFFFLIHGVKVNAHIFSFGASPSSVRLR